MNWEELAEDIRLAYRGLGNRRSPLETPHNIHPSQLERWIQAHEQIARPVLDLACLEFCKTPPGKPYKWVETFPNDQLFWLRQRLLFAQLLALRVAGFQHLALNGDLTSVREAALRWLLVEEWHETGAKIACESLELTRWRGR